MACYILLDISSFFCKNIISGIWAIIFARFGFFEVFRAFFYMFWDINFKLGIWPILKKEYQLGSYHWKLLITFSQLNIRISFFAIWCISSSWLHIPSSGFPLNTCFLTKNAIFFKEKTSHFGERCFLATPISTAGVFSQIFTTHPAAQVLRNNLMYG